MFSITKNGYFLESDILGGPLEPTNEGYALAKIIITKVCNYISHEYKNCTYKTIVPCNLYGRYDTFNYHFSSCSKWILGRCNLHRLQTG